MPKGDIKENFNFFLYRGHQTRHENSHVETIKLKKSNHK